MNKRINGILQQIGNLEDELRQAFVEQEERVSYKIKGKRIAFEHKVKETHQKLKVGLVSWLRNSQPLNILSAPIIYGMIVPFVFLDFSLTLFQSICFRLYKIPRVRRSDYIVIDRHHLAYLNVIEKLNCIYCGYTNGLISYGREIASRTEQYWCPIKHACKVLGCKNRYRCFLPYGEGTNFHEELKVFRDELSKEDT